MIRHVFALAIALALPAAAMADPTPPTAQADDAEEVARQIIDIVIPQQGSGEYIGRMTSAIAAPIKKQLEAIDRSDPGMHKLTEDFMGQMFAVTGEILIQNLPDLRTSLAHAYVHKFTRDELVEILAFARTPTGTRYLSRAADLMQDSDVQAVLVQISGQTQSRMAPVNAKFREAVAEYVATQVDAKKKAK